MSHSGRFLGACSDEKVHPARSPASPQSQSRLGPRSVTCYNYLTLRKIRSISSKSKYARYSYRRTSIRKRLLRLINSILVTIRTTLLRSQHIPQTCRTSTALGQAHHSSAVIAGSHPLNPPNPPHTTAEMASAITSRTTKVPDTSPRSPMMQQPLRTSMIGVGFRDARKSLELYGPPRRPFPSPVSASVVSKPVLESEEESPGNGETSFNLIPSESAVEGREDVVQRPATPTPPAMPPRSFSSWPAASDVLDLYLGGRLSRNPDPKSAPILGKGIIATLPVPALPTFEEAASRQRNQSSPASVPAKRPRADTTSNVDITPTQVATISTTDDTRRSTSASVEEWRKGVILDSEEQEQTERRIKRCL